MDWKIISIVLLSIVILKQAITIHRLRGVLNDTHHSLLKGKMVMEKAIAFIKQRHLTTEDQNKAADLE